MLNTRELAGIMVYTLLITVLSVIPKSSLEDIPYLFPGEDKVAHAGMYGFYVYMILDGIARRRRGMRVESRDIAGEGGLLGWGICLVVACYGAAYGILMEFLQYFMKSSERSLQVSDMVANALGAFGVACWWSLRVRRGRRFAG